MDISALPAAFFTTDRRADLTDKYVPIPTVEVVKAILDTGWTLNRAWNRKGKPTNDGFRAHAAVFRREWPDGDGETAPELLLRNSNDGTSAFRLEAGVFRFICENGLIVKADDLGQLYVRHAGRRATIDAVIAASLQLVEGLPAVMGKVQAMRSTYVNAWRGFDLINLAAQLRTDRDVSVDDLALRRAADKGDTVWHYLNRAQELAIRGTSAEDWVIGRTDTGDLERVTFRKINPLGAIATRCNRALFSTAVDMVATVKS